MYNLQCQVLEITEIFKQTLSQVFLFTAGVIVSLSFGFFMYPLVFTFYDFIWYTLGVISPMVPSIVGMEDW